MESLRQRKSSKWADVDPDVLPSWVAEMDVHLAEPIRDVLLDAVASGDTGYPSEDLAGLGEAFAAFARRRWDWYPDPTQVRAVPDLFSGLRETFVAVPDARSGVAMFVPSYPPFFEAIRLAGRELRPIRLAPGTEESGRWTFTEDVLEAVIANDTAIFLLNNPHNPTGRLFSREELTTIQDVCRRHGVLVVSDEIHALLAHDSSEFVPWMTLAGVTAEEAIVLTGASKGFNTAGLKCGLHISSGPAATVAERMSEELFAMTGLLGVLASVAAFTHGDQWLDEMIEVLRVNLDQVTTALAQLNGAVVSTPPQASYLSWLEFPSTHPDTTAASAIEQATGLKLGEGEEFDPRDGERFARLNFGTSPDLLDEILGRLSRAVAEGRFG